MTTRMLLEILAAVCFLIATAGLVARVNFVALGLLLWLISSMVRQ